MLHVYPGQMVHHLATMVENTNLAFSSFENNTVLVAPVVWKKNEKVLTLAHKLSVPVLSPAAMLLLILRRRSDFVVFHSDHWPKFWIVASLAALVGSRLIWISWSGEAQSSGLKGWINRALRIWAIPRFTRSVFLSASDRVCAEKLYGRKVRSITIPYFNPSYLKPPSRSSGRALDLSILRVQIGNTGQELNGHLACLAQLSSVRNLAFTVVYPLGYLSDVPQYIERLRTASQQSPAVSCEFIDRLLPPGEFDALVDSCDALLLASHRQRALYSIYRYLAAGKPVFLPKDAELRRDLEDLGFEVKALESLGSMTASDLSHICRRKCEANTRAAQEYLGLEAIRTKWEKVIAEAITR